MRYYWYPYINHLFYYFGVPPFMTYPSIQSGPRHSAQGCVERDDLKNHRRPAVGERLTDTTALESREVRYQELTQKKHIYIYPYGSKYLLRKCLGNNLLSFGGLSTFSDSVWIHRVYYSSSGWWLSHPSEKYEWVTVGMMTFPICGKS